MRKTVFVILGSPPVYLYRFGKPFGSGAGPLRSREYYTEQGEKGITEIKIISHRTKFCPFLYCDPGFYTYWLKHKAEKELKNVAIIFCLALQAYSQAMLVFYKNKLDPQPLPDKNWNETKGSLNENSHEVFPRLFVFCLLY